MDVFIHERYRRDPIVDHARLVDRGQCTHDNSIIFMISFE